MSEEIKCPACGYENDATRVFCHNCGVRLPRTEEQIKEKVEQTRQATEEAKKVLREGAKKAKKRSLNQVLAGLVHAFITTGFYAALVAAILLALRPPDNLPPPATPDSRFVERANRQINAATQPGYNGTMEISQEQLNSYLATEQIIQSRPLLNIVHPEIRRPFVVLEKGDFSFGIEYQISNLSLFLQTSFDISGGPGSFSLEIMGGSVGRLPLHPLIFTKAFPWYQPAAEVLHQQLKILSEAESLSVTPGGVRATWNRPAAPRPTSPPAGQPFSRPSLPVSPSNLR